MSVVQDVRTHALERLGVRPPTDRDSIIAELERLGAEVTSAATRFDGAAFFRPQHEHGERKWSPAEQLRHLTRSTRPLAQALAMRRLALLLRFGPCLRAARSYEQVTGEYRELLKQRPDSGRFAPTADSDDSEARRQELIERWKQAVGALTDALARWPERSLDRYRLPHPLLGPMSVREILYFTVFHTAHHGSQVVRRS